MNTYEPFAFGRALAASELTTKAKVTGFCLSVYADGKTGYCYPTQEQLAEASSQSVLTITRALAELAAAGFVTVARNERKRFNRNNLYWLRVPRGTPTLTVAVDEPAIDPEPQPPKVAAPSARPKVRAPVKTPRPIEVPPAPTSAHSAFPMTPAWQRS
jgi:DNA-binding transcriptional MocR family regulator